MKFNFKIQQYQTDAVDAVVKVFQGQGYHDRISYIRDVGKKQEVQQMRLNVEMDQHNAGQARIGRNNKRLTYPEL